MVKMTCHFKDMLLNNTCIYGHSQDMKYILKCKKKEGSHQVLNAVVPEADTHVSSFLPPLSRLAFITFTELYYSLSLCVVLLLQCFII